MKSLVLGTAVLLVAVIAQPTAVEAQTDDSILSDSHIVSQRYVEAEVIRVSPRDRTITVKGELRGQTRQFVVPERARISVNGKDAGIRDIRKGDNIRMTFVRRSNEVVVDQIRMPDSPVSLADRRAASQPAVAQATPAVLPSTASPLPAILLAGLVLLAGAGVLKRIRS